jgi:SAM-dependent methyltransferase
MRNSLLTIPLLLLSAGAVAAPQFGSSGTLDVPYVPTRPELVEQMLKLANVKKTDVVYDLGCGDGRIVIMAAQKFGARAVGVDADPERIKEANANAEKAGVADRVKFVEGNLFNADIHDATVVTLYLLPDVNMRLRPKLLKDLKPGTRIVSHSFDMGDWKPDREIEVEGSRLYLWTVPAPGAMK